ncbi:TetR/AcrR family transcriptional regulator [Flammeovirga sp. MY04]|uniref:TetR/AcrR family transcriptional regulator n=1 Tax=Flammeovirga sp. MY04 TaxID=1191459 RepID=UPI00080614F1|nr:TetR/AcrR family transcriptional regulator [Flammeovirga sp. MY04]ANQ51370.1 TetR/AcrR family transcriptional regulator [Flammeovirga sp. MY04]
MEKDTKSHIIEVGIRLFQEKGMNRVSLNQVIKETDLSKGAFYHHFKNKEELIVACVMAFWNNLSKEFLSIPYQELSFRELLDLLLQQYHMILNSMETNGENAFEFYMNILFYIKNDNKLLDMSKGYFTQYNQILSHCLLEDQKKGIIKEDVDIQTTAQHVSIASEGFALMAFSKIYDDPIPVIEKIYHQIYNSIKK